MDELFVSTELISFGPESKCTCSYVKVAQIQTNGKTEYGFWEVLRACEFLTCPAPHTAHFPCYPKIEPSILIKTLIQGPSGVRKNGHLSVLCHILVEHALYSKKLFQSRRVLSLVQISHVRLFGGRSIY
jgi:hypothetical protein